MNLEDYINMSLEQREKFVINKKKKELIKELYLSTYENDEALLSENFLRKQFGVGLTEKELDELFKSIKSLVEIEENLN